MHSLLTDALGLPSGEPTQNNPPVPPQRPHCPPWLAGCGVEVHTTSRAVSCLLPSPLLHLSEHSHKYFLLILICTGHILFSVQEPQKIKTVLITFEFPLIINLGAIINKFM